MLPSSFRRAMGRIGRFCVIRYMNRASSAGRDFCWPESSVEAGAAQPSGLSSFPFCDCIAHINPVAIRLLGIITLYRAPLDNRGVNLPVARSRSGSAGIHQWADRHSRDPLVPSKYRFFGLYNLVASIRPGFRPGPSPFARGSILPAFYWIYIQELSLGQKETRQA